MSTASQETIERLKEQAAAQTDETPEEPEVSPDPEKTEKAATREYILLLKGTRPEELVKIGAAEAHNAEAAIESLGQNLKTDATYVAVPSRYWTEKTVEIETTTSIKLK